MAKFDGRLGEKSKDGSIEAAKEGNLIQINGREDRTPQAIFYNPKLSYRREGGREAGEVEFIHPQRTVEVERKIRSTLSISAILA